MDKLQIFSAISSLTLIGGIYYYYELVDKLKSNNSRLQNDIKSLNKKIDSVFQTQRQKFILDIEKQITKEKENFNNQIINSFENFGDDLVFEFKVDETLQKSEFISLKKLISDKKDNYSFLINSILTKNKNEKKQIETLKSDLDELTKSANKFEEIVNNHIEQVKEFVKTATANSKKGKSMAKDFEERISNLESLSFEKVMDDSSSGDDYSFIGDSDMSAEMEDLKIDYSPKNILPPNPTKPSI